VHQSDDLHQFELKHTENILIDDHMSNWNFSFLNMPSHDKSLSKTFLHYNVKFPEVDNHKSGTIWCILYYKGYIIVVKNSFLGFLEAIRIHYSLHCYFCLNCFWRICYAIMGFWAFLQIECRNSSVLLVIGTV